MTEVQSSPGMIVTLQTLPDSDRQHALNNEAQQRAFQEDAESKHRATVKADQQAADLIAEYYALKNKARAYQIEVERQKRKIEALFCSAASPFCEEGCIKFSGRLFYYCFDPDDGTLMEIRSMSLLDIDAQQEPSD
ncbi:MAG: hypothetical protein AAFN18_22740 [Cyanobacteria bacterium J06554_6]